MITQYKENFRYKISTPSGYQPFSGIRKLSKSKYNSLKLSNGKEINCSETHPFISKNKKVKSNRLNVGDTIDSNSDGVVSIESIKLNNSTIELYDIVNVLGGNTFNVDGIISHNCDFISSGNTVIEPELLVWYKTTHVKDPIEKRGVDHGYWLWEYPNYETQYLVSADVGRGDATDFSAFQVIDVKNLKQVGEYRGKVGTKIFGKMLVAVATEFNNAILIIENANIGWAVLQEAIDLNYANLFYGSSDLQYVDVEIQMTNKINRQEKNMKPGFTTSTKSRPLMISKMEAYMREKSVIIQSTRTIDELLVFVWNGPKAEAANGYNDDLVMSLSIGLWVRDTALRLDQESTDLQKRILANISRTQPASDTTKIYTPNPSRPVVDPWKMKIGGRDEDLTWLIK